MNRTRAVLDVLARNQTRAVLTVYAVATGAVLFIALPGLWRSLAALAVPALYAIWVLTSTPHRGAHAADPGQADAEQEDWTLELGEPVPVTWLPDEGTDPIGYYAAMAGRYVQPWQQRGPDDAPQPLTAPVPLASSETSGGPVPTTGGPPAADNGTGDGGPPDCPECGNDGNDTTTCDGCKFEICMACGFPCACGELELDHDDPADDDDDQADELAWTWPGPFDQQADVLLERVRAGFNLLRRMYL